MTTTSAVGKIDPWHAVAARIHSVIDESPDVKTYELSVDVDEFSWQPGQFNMLYVPGVGEAAISICGGDQERGLLRHTIRRVGSVTAALAAAEVGTSIGIRGPFGVPWPLEQIESSPQQRDVIIVAGGIGLAPLRSLITHLIQHRRQVGRVSVLVGARTAADLLYADQYDSWRQQELSVETTIDRASPHWKGHVGVVTLLIERLSIARPESTLVMTCGPEVMMRYVAQSAMHRGIPEKNIWVAMERNMNCAIGLCGHCQLGPEFICKDGPVFPYDSIAHLLPVLGL